MSSIASPPQRVLYELSGLLAVSPGYYQQLAFWAPRVHVVVGPVDRRRTRPPGFTLILDQEMAAAWQGSPPPEPKIVDVGGKRIAVLDVHGFLHKGDVPGRAGSATLREQLQELVADNLADGILLRIDSPGGTVAGTADLVTEIRQARKSKPVYAFIEDLAASAAYWIASQAEKVYANVQTALVGSIGTFVGLYDRKGQFSKQGVKAVVIKAGELKAAGFPGTEITAKQQAYFKGLVDQTQAEFSKAIAHRRINPVATTTGRLYLAQDAAKLRLIDGVKGFDATLVELASKAKRA